MRQCCDRESCKSRFIIKLQTCHHAAFEKMGYMVCSDCGLEMPWGEPTRDEHYMLQHIAQSMGMPFAEFAPIQPAYSASRVMLEAKKKLVDAWREHFYQQMGWVK